MQLIDNWRQAYKMFSVWALFILGAIPAAIELLPLVWLETPEEIKMLIPNEYMRWVLFAIAMAGLYGRLVKQPGVEKWK